MVAAPAWGAYVWLPMHPSVPPLKGTRETLERLLSFDTSPSGGGHRACADWLKEQLEACGFSCRLHGPSAQGAPPLLEAHRPARGLSGHVVLYGHYDVAPHDAELGWTSSPRDLTEREGRWFARGVADNKGALAARLVAIACSGPSPALTWFIQGEEETGSHLASEVLSERLPLLQAELWMDETGYHDHPERTLRLIACQMGPGSDRRRAPDAALRGLLDELERLAAHWGIGARLEVRGLNKGAVEGGCPFNHALPEGARYLALGVNDARAGIHGPDESVPLWTFALHAKQLQAVFQWVGWMARGGA